MISENERQAENATAAATTEAGGRREAVGLRAAERPTAASDATLRASAHQTAKRPEEITPEQYFEVECLNSARYHEDREQFFSWTNKIGTFVIVALGTAALSPLKTEFPVIIPAAITLIGLINLVFDTNGKARLHAGLKKDFYNVLADSKENANLQKLRKRLVLIYAEEPPVMHAVSALAYNGAMENVGRPSKYLIKIGVWTRLFRHIWPYTEASFKRYEDII